MAVGIFIARNVEDADISNPQEGQALIWQGGKWVNADIIAPTSLDQLTDVDLSVPPQDGNVLQYNQAEDVWKPGVGGSGAGIYALCRSWMGI